MKNKISPVLIITALFITCLLHGSLSAQNWKLFDPNYISTFREDHGFLYVIRMDSIEVNGSDTTYYPMSELSNVSFNGCDVPELGWLGKKITVNDSLTTFENKQGNHVFIKHNAPTGTQWEVSERTLDSTYVLATIAQQLPDTIWGEPDSVKHISFGKFDKSGSPVASELDTILMKISKNHGLLQSNKFSVFPFAINMTTVQLVGTEKNAKGVQRLTVDAIFDIEPGDVFYKYSEERYPVTSLIKKAYHHKDSVIYYHKTADSVFYTEFRHTKLRTGEDNDWFGISETWTEQFDTVYHAVDLTKHYFNLYPRERDYSIADSSGYALGHLLIKQGDTLQGKNIAMNSIFKKDSCWFVTDEEDMGHTGIYYCGAGGPYNQNVPDSLRLYLFGMVKINGKKYGDHSDFEYLRIHENDQSGMVSIIIYPNPVKDVLNITAEFPMKGSLEIFDVYGRKVLEDQPVNGMNESVYLGALPKGLYSVHLIDSQGKIWKTVKMVKR